MDYTWLVHKSRSMKRWGLICQGNGSWPWGIPVEILQFEYDPILPNPGGCGLTVFMEIC